jgi:hypothetical protein
MSLAPDGATHYCGQLRDEPSFFKLTQVGVADKHWWVWEDGVWKFWGVNSPRMVKPLP